jgi:hypothetical protein
MAINPKNLGLAAGILWGFAVFITGLLNIETGLGWGFINSMGSIYIGYKGTMLGSFLGLIYGFLDGFTGGYLLAFLYNYFEGEGKSAGKSKK